MDNLSISINIIKIEINNLGINKGIIDKRGDDSNINIDKAKNNSNISIKDKNINKKANNLKIKMINIEQVSININKKLNK